MIETSPTLAALAVALHGAQGALDGVARDRSNPHFKSRYATLEAVIDAAKPALQAHGLSVSQWPGPMVDGRASVTTMLLHVSGEWMRCSVHVPLAKSDPQGLGSAITYASRYSLMAALALPPVDDDGEAAMQREPARGAPAGNVRELPARREAVDGIGTEQRRYLDTAKATLGTLGNRDALGGWWRTEADKRRAARIVEGSPALAELTEAFQARSKAVEAAARRAEPDAADNMGAG